MDTHLIKPKSKEKKRPLDTRKLLKILKSFLPVFVLSALLPFLIGFVVTPPDIGFFTRADSTPELRVWVEPASVVMSAGSQTTLTIFASFDSDTMLIPEISVDIAGDDSLVIDSPKVTYEVPFSGRTELGRINVTAVAPGEGQVRILEDSINITAFDEPIEITTGSSNVVIR